MLASIGNTATPVATSTLVATALPNSSALRSPYDNVAPSVSSAQLDNNASANRDFLAKTNNLQSSPSVNEAAANFHIGRNSNLLPFTANAQTAFLTQLASGDISPEVHGIFVQYEKLLSYANVKYKPSNAGKPVDPVGLFSTLLKPRKNDRQHIELADTANPPQLPETMETAQAGRPLPEKKFTLPQLDAYSATIIRNRSATPADLESA